MAPRLSSRATTRYVVLPASANSQIVETAYQKAKNFDKLSFLYLITGNTKKLGMMQAIAAKRGDQMSRFQNSLYIGDVEGRVAVLRETGMCKSQN